MDERKDGNGEDAIPEPTPLDLLRGDTERIAMLLFACTCFAAAGSFALIAIYLRLKNS